MTERPAYIPIEREIQTKLKALKGSDSYSEYLDRLMRSVSRKDD